MATPAVPTPAAPAQTPAGFEIYDPDHDPAAVAAAAPAKAPVTPPVVPAAAPTATVPASGSVHPPKLLIQARQLGIADTEAAGLSTADLKELVTEAAISRVVDRSPAAPVAPTAPVAGPSPTETPAVPAAVPPPNAASLLTKLKEVVDSDLADAIAGYIDGRLGAMPDLARVEKLEGAVGHALSFVQQKQAAEADNQLDQGFEDLGAGYAKFFGTGNARSMTKDDPNFKRRRTLVMILRANPPKDGDIRKAVADLGAQMYGDLADPAEPGEGKPKPKARPKPVQDPVTGRFSADDYQDAAMVLPTTRQAAAPVNGRAKAIASVAKIQQDAGSDGIDINQGQDVFLPPR